MHSSVELEEFLLLLVADQAWFRSILCTLIFEGKDKSLSLSLSMFFSRTMAGFTSFLSKGNLGIKYILPMGVIFFEGIVEVWMAPFAGLRLHISFLLGLHLLLAERGETNEGYRSH
jgi:hypothetical protein